MDRLPVAHSGPILTLDWSNAASSTRSRGQDGIADHHDSNMGGRDGSAAGGWIVSGGMDRTVKVLTTSLY
jgi:hypothetical protein